MTLCIALGGGCASTYSARSFTPSGFLERYDLLQPGEADSVWFYVSPDYRRQNYPAVLIEPVVIYGDQSGRGLSRLTDEEAQALVNYFDAALRDHLDDRFKVVDEPGPGVARLRIAITDIEGASVTRDIISSVVPISLAISSAKRFALGEHTAVGSAGVEGEARDSVSGELLIALADARIGRKVTGKLDKFKTYRTAYDAFDLWSREIRRLMID